MTAAAVIPAPIANVKVIVVKKLVIGSRQSAGGSLALHPYVRVSVRPCVGASVCCCVRPCVPAFLRAYIHLSVRLSFSAFVRSSVRPFMCASISTSV